MREINTIVEDETEDGGPGAAVAVVKNGEVIHRKGYGLANLEWQIPIEPDTVFRLASITKQFTATAIMMLCEEGKLSLDDPITKFLPDYPTSGHDIFVHHLLTHTSGIKSYTGIDGWFPDRCMADMEPADIADIFKQIPFDFRPGTAYSYNNSGYHLLGQIIEAVADCRYESFIQRHIFDPLGMKNSYYLHNPPITPRRASGYHLAESSFENAPYISMTQPYAAGALGSTIDDLVLWDKALAENQLITPETLDQMLTPVQLEDGTIETYGFGWSILDYHGHRMTNHSGGIHGFSTFIARFVDDGLTVVVLSNLDSFDAERSSRKIARLFLDLPPLNREPVTISNDVIERLTGRYLIDGVHPIEIVKIDDNALAIQDEHRASKIVPLSETTFFVEKDPEVDVTFEEETAGRYHKITINRPFYSDSATREPAE